MERKPVVIAQEALEKEAAVCGQIKALWASRGRTPRAFVDTYGCQQNEADSERIRGMLRASGYEIVDTEEGADCIVINTCAIREHAETRVYGNVGALVHTKARHPEQKIFLCGCMMGQPQVVERIKNSYRHVDGVFNPHELWRFPELLQSVLRTNRRIFAVDDSAGNIAEGIPVVRSSDLKAWVSIMYGCNNFCSYCIVPYVRGREKSRPLEDIVAEAERAGELFLATSGGDDPSRLSGELVQAGFGDARVTVAERLSYPNERITCATASEIAGQTFDDLNVMLIEFAGGAGSPVGSSAASEAPAGASAPAAASSAADFAGASRAASSRWPYASSGIPDELFIRGDVPMTKQEVRAVALAKLRLTATDTVWDVGAGTGSVSIEAALVARTGSVWAVERNAAGVRLIRENADAFGCGNVHAIPGVAPEALAKLPVPDAVFVGGSAGELPSIVEAALEKNSQVRLCVPCVTVETLTEACALLSGSRFKGFEACQVSAARAEAVGSHHLMKAQNPVFLVSARGAGGEGGAR